MQGTVDFGGAPLVGVGYIALPALPPAPEELLVVAVPDALLASIASPPPCASMGLPPAPPDPSPKLVVPLQAARHESKGNHARRRFSGRAHSPQRSTRCASPRRPRPSDLERAGCQRALAGTCPNPGPGRAFASSAFFAIVAQRTAAGDRRPARYHRWPSSITVGLRDCVPRRVQAPALKCVNEFRWASVEVPGVRSSACG